MEVQEVEKRIEDWLNQGYASSTVRNYRWSLAVFLEFLNETEGGEWTPERLVGEREKDLRERKFSFEQKVVDFYEWLKSYRTKPTVIVYERRNAKTGLIHEGRFPVKGGKLPSDSKRKVFVTGIRSFFAFHRLDLRLTRQQKRILGKKARQVYTDYEFSLTDIAEMAEFANPQERYILLDGKDIGLRAGDFVGLTQGRFARALKRRETEEPPVFLGKAWTEKEGVYAYPFLTNDGLEAARVWLRVLESKGLRDDEQSMLAIEAKELTTNLRRLVKKAGIETHGQRVRFHRLRQFLIDRISLKMSESKWKQIVGKQIDEKAYVSPLELREAYRSVMDRIQISTVKTTSGLTQEEIEKVKMLLELTKVEEFRKMVSKLVKEGKLKVSP